MAEEGPTGSPAALAGGLFAFLAVISLGWFMFGGPERADLSGYFLAPPTAPQIIVPAGGGGIIQGSTTTPPQDPEDLNE